VYLLMTVAEAGCEYRAFMSRMDVAFAFGHGCSISDSHPTLRALRVEADRLLVRLRALGAAAGDRPLNMRATPAPNAAADGLPGAHER
jgi:hypothetical protein